MAVFKLPKKTRSDDQRENEIEGTKQSNVSERKREKERKRPKDGDREK